VLSDRNSHGPDVPAGDGTPPSGNGLAANIIRFADLLRQAGIPVFFSSVLDALSSLPRLDLSDSGTFYHLLRCLFVTRREHLATFDELFSRFWLSERTETAEGCPLPRDGDEQPEEAGTDAGSLRVLRGFAEGNPVGDREPRPTYSPLAAKGRVPEAVSAGGPSEVMVAAMAELLERLSRRLSRRYRFGANGRRLSLSRLMRRNLRFGGELLLLDYRRRKVKQRPVVVFCDVSGSMDVFTLMAFQFIHALKKILPRLEVFFFSTELSRVTACFRQQDFSRTMAEVSRQVRDWKGGTRIGHCLKQFNDTFGRHWLLHRALVMVFSDGWDRGEIGLLRQQMAQLKRRVYRILWLNPLAGTRDYQPVCQGMRAALPYTDYFLAARSLHDFRDTGELLEKLLQG
jgi:uncharacterized protein with von Willebrand factor type A (vWA) domain